jgi:hypothetical protein
MMKLPLASILALSVCALSTTLANAVELEIVESSPYLVIGMTPSSDGDAFHGSNDELGANTNTVPSTVDPNLDSVFGAGGSVPLPSSGYQSFITGETYDGNVAITSSTGQYNVSNDDIYADQGILCTASAANCDNGNSGSRYDDATPVDLRTLQSGDGIIGGIDHTNLLSELSDANAFINALTSTGTLTGNSEATKFENTTVTFSLSSGLNVIDLASNGNDWSLTNTHLIIDGPTDAFAIFRVPDDANFTMNQSTILAGDSGIGLNNILFHSDKNDNNTHFNMQDVILNGVAFWDLSGQAGSPFNIQNANGCTQIVGEKVDFSNVRFNRCSFGYSSTVVPVPAAVWLFGSGLLGLVGMARRKKA